MSNLKLDDARRIRIDKAQKYKRVFGTKDGKEVLLDILYSARITRPCRTQEDEGARRLGLAILKQCDGSYEKALNKIVQIEETDYE